MPPYCSYDVSQVSMSPDVQTLLECGIIYTVFLAFKLNISIIDHAFALKWKVSCLNTETRPNQIIYLINFIRLLVHFFKIYVNTPRPDLLNAMKKSVCIILHFYFIHYG